MRYAFIAENRLIVEFMATCRMLAVHPSGFYARLRERLNPRALADQRQTEALKQAWDEIGEVYGYRKLPDDLCNLGEDISPNLRGVWHLWPAQAPRLVAKGNEALTVAGLRLWRTKP